MAGGNGEGSEANQLNNPAGVYVDSNGTIFVSDYFNHRIQKWATGATQGTTVAGGDGQGSAANQLSFPTGVYVDSNENIFVADANNHRIQKVQYQPQIVIAAGQTSGTMSFGAINDLIFEGKETIVLEIDSIANASVSPTQSVLNLTIIDDDTGVLLNLSNSTLFEGQSSIQLLVSLSNPSSQNVSANLSFSGTAVLGTDYTVDKETINFVPGDTVETVTLSAIDDNLVEILESIQIQVSGGTNISAPYPSITAYLSSKPLVSLSLDKTSMSESGGVATLTATLSAPTNKAVSIGFKPAGTAIYRGDYDASFVEKDEAITVAGGNGEGSAANQLWYPRGVSVDSNGNIFIADLGKHRIQKWTPGATQGITVAGGNGSGSAANQLDSPFGVYVDSNGTIFVADADNHRIQKWTPGATQGITVAGGNGGGSAANQLSYPTGVYVDSHGTIFVADRDNHRIQKWVSGATQGITVAGGNGRGSAANQLNYPTGVSVDSNSNIFVADSWNLRIQKWVSGATQGITVAGGNGRGSAANQLDYPFGISVDSSGTIFVADYFNHRIQKWVPGATQGITVAGGNGEGSAGNQLSYPFGVYVDSNGNIFVADEKNHRIQKIQYQPQIVIAAGQTSGTMSFSAINDLIFEGNETIVLETDSIANASVSPTQSALNLTIIDNDSSPSVLLNLSNSTLFEEQSSIQLLVSLSNPSSQNVSVNLSFSGTAVLGTDYTVDKETINFVPDDTVETVTLSAIDDNLVEILESIQIQVSGGTNISAPYPSITAYLSSKPTVSLSLDKTSMSESGGVATLTATLSAPTNKAVSIAFKLAGTANYRGDYEASFVGKDEIITVAGGNGSGSDANQLNYPKGVYVDSHGNIFIADAWNNRIQKWVPGATQGITVAGGNGPGSSANQLDFPNGVYVDSNGTIFVADAWNNRIQKWTSGATQGITVAGGDGGGSSANQLNSPLGVSVDSNGTIFVADAGNNRIQKWTSGATQGITVAGGNGLGSAANQLYYPSGISVDSNGNIFVADEINHRIQKWTPGATQGITVAGGNGQYFADNHLNFPKGVSVDSHENIFVADYGNYRIQKWTPGATRGITVGNYLGKPTGIYVDGNIFIAGTDNHRIQKVQYQPQIIIAAGETSGTVSFDAINDLTFEGNETIVLEIDSIANVSLYPTQPALNLTIIEDDSPPSVLLNLSNSTLVEGQSSVQLLVSLSNPSSHNVSVNFSFSGTAVLGEIV